MDVTWSEDGSQDPIWMKVNRWDPIWMVHLWRLANRLDVDVTSRMLKNRVKYGCYIDRDGR